MATSQHVIYDDKILTINDNIHGNIKISGFERAVLDTSSFNRLHNVYQNSSVYLTFPSCRTKRYEHSIGVMHLAGQMIYHSFCNTHPEVLARFIGIVKNWLVKFDCDAMTILADDTGFTSKLFYRSYMPSSLKEDEQQTIYIFLFQAIRVAGLLHDVGHPPFSHVVEKGISRALRESTKECDLSSDIAKRIEYFSIQLNQCDTPLHELLGYSVISNIFTELEYLAHFKEMNNKTLRLLSKVVLAIFNPSKYFPLSRYDKNTLELELANTFHKYISSTIDADRLDYIVRDSKSAGAGSEEFPYSRLLDNMKIIETDNHFKIAYSYKVHDLMDEVIRRRFYIFNYINYHHRSMKMATLLEDIVVALMKEKIIEYINNKSSIKNGNLLAIDIEGIFMVLNEVFPEKEEYKSILTISQLLSQWDDNWMIVMLKQYFFSTNINPIIKCEIDEFVTGRKTFYSVIKREYDMTVCSDQFYMELEKLIYDSKPVISDEIKHVITNKMRFYKLLIQLKKSILPEDFRQILVETQTHLNSLSEYRGFYDIRISIPKRDVGMESAEWLFHDEKEIDLYLKVSLADEEIKSRIDALPYFFMYYRIIDASASKEMDANKILELKQKTGVKIAKIMYERLFKKSGS